MKQYHNSVVGKWEKVDKDLYKVLVEDWCSKILPTVGQEGSDTDSIIFKLLRP